MRRAALRRWGRGRRPGRPRGPARAECETRTRTTHESTTFKNQVQIYFEKRKGEIGPIPIYVLIDSDSPGRTELSVARSSSLIIGEASVMRARERFAPDLSRGPAAAGGAASERPGSARTRFRPRPRPRPRRAAGEPRAAAPRRPWT